MRGLLLIAAVVILLLLALSHSLTHSLCLANRAGRVHQQHSPASRLPRLPPPTPTPRSARLIGASGRSRPLSACQSARPGLRGSAAPALSARQSSLCPFRPHRRSTPCAFDLFLKTVTFVNIFSYTNKPIIECLTL